MTGNYNKWTQTDQKTAKNDQKEPTLMGRKAHREQVGAAFGLLADGRRRVGGLRDVDAELLLAGAGCGRHRRRVVAQTAAAVTRLEGQEGN